MSQIVEEEKLELEATLNRQRREDRCGVFQYPLLAAFYADMLRTIFALFYALCSDLRSSIQNIRDALDARHRVLFASILSR